MIKNIFLNHFVSICESLVKTKIINKTDTKFILVLDGSLECIDQTFGSMMMWSEMEKASSDEKHPFHIQSIYTVGSMGFLLALCFRYDELNLFGTFMYYTILYNKRKKQPLSRESIKSKQKNTSDLANEWKTHRTNLEKTLRKKLSAIPKKELETQLLTSILTPSVYYMVKHRVYSKSLVDDVLGECFPRENDDNKDKSIVTGLQKFYNPPTTEWKRTLKLKNEIETRESILASARALETNSTSVREPSTQTLLVGDMFQGMNLSRMMEKIGVLSSSYGEYERDLNIWKGMRDVVDVNQRPRQLTRRCNSSSIVLEKHWNHRDRIVFEIQILVLMVMSVFNASRHLGLVCEWLSCVLSAHLPWLVGGCRKKMDSNPFSNMNRNPNRNASV